MVSKQKQTAELIEEILAMDRIRKPEWFPSQEDAQRRWIEKILDVEISRALELAFRDACRGDDWNCFVCARIAANYAFVLRPDLHEPRSWRAPIAMQWRGVKPQQWYPGYTWREEIRA